VVSRVAFVAVASPFFAFASTRTAFASARTALARLNWHHANRRFRPDLLQISHDMAFLSVFFHSRGQRLDLAGP